MDLPPRLRRRMWGEALPRRLIYQKVRAVPLVRPLAHVGRSPNQGQSPRLISKLTARQSLASHPAAKPKKYFRVLAGRLVNEPARQSLASHPAAEPRQGVHPSLVSHPAAEPKQKSSI